MPTPVPAPVPVPIVKLHLHPVAARQGLLWVRSAVVVFAKKPLALLGLFMLFVFGVLMLMLLPFVGGLVGVALLPMLTLGFMIATRSVLAGGQALPQHLVAGLLGPDKPRRTSQWLLCIGYAVATLGVIVLALWVDGGSFDRLQTAVARGDAQKDIDILLADPDLLSGMLLRLGLALAVSVPFWHAPALVYWGGQGALQALFSSTLALWQARGAFALYGLCLSLLLVAVGLLLGAVAGLLGTRAVLGIVAMALCLSWFTLFYVSLWFSFADCFGAHEAPLAR